MQIYQRHGKKYDATAIRATLDFDGDYIAGRINCLVSDDAHFVTAYQVMYDGAGENFDEEVLSKFKELN